MARHLDAFVYLFCTLFSVTSFCIGLSATCHAAEGDKVWITPVTLEESYQQSVRSATDGAGGAIIVWEDNRNGPYDIFAKRLDHQGYIVWGHGDLQLTGGSTNQRHPQIVPDGSGGAIIAWWHLDLLFPHIWRVFAQRIDDSGEVQWGTGGMAVSTDVGVDRSDPVPLAIAGDDAGGAYIAFEAATGPRIVHINHNGSMANPDINGMELGSGLLPGANLSMAKDGHGGVFVAWVTASEHIAVQRVDLGDNPQLPILMTPWGLDPTYVSEDNGSGEYHPSIINDGTDGAFVAYGRHIADQTCLFYNAMTDTCITYVTELRERLIAQHINFDGNVQWQPDGVVLHTDDVIEEQLHLAPTAAIDGSGGVYVGWQSPSYYVFAHVLDNVYIQRLGADGSEIGDTISLTLHFKDLFTGTYEIKSQNPRLVADGSGRAVLVADVMLDALSWGSVWSAYALGIENSAISWTTEVPDYGGVEPGFPQIVFDGTGPSPTGPFIAWQDSWFDYENRGANIFAAKLAANYVRPDFTVESITIDPPFPGEFEPFTISVTYTNIGLADFDGLIELGFNSGELPFSIWQYTNLFGGLEQGEGYTAQHDFNSGREAGSYTVQASIDHDDLIGESDEENNDLAVPLLIYNVASPLPDLIIESIQTSPPSPEPDEPFSVYVTVRNQGETAITEPFSGTFSNGAPNSVTEFWQLPGLGQGAATILQFPQAAGLPAGTYTLSAAADTESDVAEILEDNNGLSVSLNIAPLGDLVVDSIVVQPPFPAPWEPFSVEITIRNQGEADITAPFSCRLLDGNKPIPQAHYWQVPSLAAGESTTHHLDFTAGREADRYGLFAGADVDEEISETIETNNSLGFLLAVGSCPGDLDGDFDVDGLDALRFSLYAETANPLADLDGNGLIGDGADFLVLAGNFGSGDCLAELYGYLAIEPDVVVLPGQSTELAVTLSSAAPVGGTTVSLVSDDPGIAQISSPTELNIAEGETAATFSVSGVSPGTATLRAIAAGYAQGTGAMRVVAGLISLPENLSLPLATDVTLPITIAPDPAPAGGLAIALASSNSDIVVLTPTVIIPEGTYSANGLLRATQPGSAAMTASSPDYLEDTSLVSTDAAFDILEASVTFNTGFSDEITIQLESSGTPTIAPAGGILVTLLADDPTCVSVPSSATIPAGQVNVTVGVDYGGTTVLPCTTTVSAVAPDIDLDSVPVTVNPGAGLSLPASATVGAGLQYGWYYVQLDTGNHGGTSVTVESSDPALALVSPDQYTPGTASIVLPVADGSTSTRFFIQGLEGVTGSASITASAPTFISDTMAVGIVQPALRLSGLLAATTALSADDPFQVSIGIPRPDNSSIAVSQYVRVSGDATGITATVDNSEAAVGQLVSDPLTGQSVTVTIAEGSYLSASTVANGGVAFDPLDVGTSTVSASIPGFIATTAGSSTVTVSTPEITLPGDATIGAGLQYGWYYVQLGGSNHGGVDVTVESGDPSLALVSPDATTPGSAAIVLPVADGSTFARFYIQGLEGVTGSTTFTASSPAFISDTMPVEVVQPALRLAGLLTATSTLSADDPFVVNIGIPNADNSSIALYQYVRASGDDTGITVTVTNSNSTIGQLVTDPLTGQSVTVIIAEGQYQSANTVATGGVAFDPLAFGSTTVSATIPGFIATIAASSTVTVSAPEISLSGDATIGAGLQYGWYYVQLGGADHGGVDVTVESGDPALALVSPDATTPGSAAIVLPVADGDISTRFYIQGLEGTTGTTTITASSPAFLSDTMAVEVVQPALRLTALTSSTTTLAADDPFQVSIGLPTADHSSIMISQYVRASGDATGMTATVVNSDASVGQLVTDPLTGQSVTVTIEEGASLSAGSVVAGGVAFDPLASGTTTVSATIPGFIATDNASMDVTVGAASLDLPDSATIGAGLQYGWYYVQLDSTAHGGVDVTVSSNNSALALVAADATSVGSESLILPVADGANSARFFVQGLESVLGTTTILATAPGFIEDSMSVEIVQPALRINGLDNTTSVLAGDDPFQVSIGIPNALNTSIAMNQYLRVSGDATGVTATINSSNGEVAELVTGGLVDQAVTVDIAEGSYLSPSTVAAGGVALSVLAPGETTVSATIPVFIATDAASVPVTVE